MYLRQNGTQEFLGDMKGVSQPTVSRIVTVLVPVVRAVLEEFVPSAGDAIQMASGRVCLVNGTITCGCRKLCHPMRPGNTRGSGHRAGPGAEPGRSRLTQVDGDARKAVSVAVRGAHGANCSDRCTR